MINAEMWPGFEPKSGHVVLAVDEVALGQVFSYYLSFPCQFVFHRHLPSNSSRRTKWTYSHPIPNVRNAEVTNKIQ
jgi:hypothetical protein